MSLRWDPSGRTPPTLQAPRALRWALALACGGAGCRLAVFDDLAPINVALVERKDTLCLPPQRPFRWLWGVEGTEVVLSGQLMPLGEGGIAISAAGQEVRLWTVDLADRPILRLASGLVDQDNAFELAFELPSEAMPGSAEEELHLGLELARSQVLHPVTAFVRPTYPHGADLLCTYFADEDGTLVTEAEVGQKLLLVARGYGALPAGPSLDVVVLAPDARVSGLVYRAELPPAPDHEAAVPWRASLDGTADADLALHARIDDPQGWMLPLDGFFARSPPLLVAP